MFNPGRLRLARQRRKLTKRGLAEKLGVAPRTIVRYEQGDIRPPDRTMQRLSEIVQFPLEFFSGPDLDEPTHEGTSFRAMASMPARERGAALMAAALGFILDDWAEQQFNLPRQDILDLGAEEPEAAARSLRQYWGIGERPIRNMVHLLEAKGVRVFSLAEETRTVDAFSLWRREKAYVFLNTIKTPEHSRFDAAHELGHLVLHRHGGPGGPDAREAEEQANRFAASFLMPSADVNAMLPRVSSLEQIIQGKKRWSVSVAALNHRLHKLKLTSDWQNRMFCIQITERGFRTKEPCGIQRETSLVWQKIFDELRKERFTKAQLADALHLPVKEIENLVFQLVTMVSIEGTGSGKTRRRAALKLVDPG